MRDQGAEHVTPDDWMKRERLLDVLREIEADSDTPGANIDPVEALLDYIDDDLIREEFGVIAKWYGRG